MATLWAQNEGFVRTLAAKYYFLADWEDLLQAGYIGLHTAAERYRPDAGANFLTYAAYWIRHEMQRGTVSPTKAISFDAPLTEDGDDDLYTLIPGDAVDPSQSAQDENTAAILWEEVGKLEPPEREAIVARYREEQSIQDIADAEGTTYSRIAERLRRGRRALQRNYRIQATCAELYSYNSALAYSSGRAAHGRFEGSTVERLAEGREKFAEMAAKDQDERDLQEVSRIMEHAPELWEVVNDLLKLGTPDAPDNPGEALELMQETGFPEKIPALLEIARRFED